MSEHPILEFWFGTIAEDGSVSSDTRKRWWTKSPAFDDLCREQFEAELLAAAAGQREALKQSLRGSLAFILLCDQISRNIYRDKPESFATDPLALAVSKQLIESARDKQLTPVERSFAYMPLMHSEDPAVQELSIEKFTELQQAGHDNLEFAIRHKAIIDRFGRFPHRNAILGRTSSSEELAFLEQPGSSF